MSLIVRIGYGHFDNITTAGAVTTPAYRRALRARIERITTLSPWMRRALSAKLPTLAVNGAAR